MRDKERGNYERWIKLSILESLAEAKRDSAQEERLVAVVHDFIVEAATRQIRSIGSNLSDVDDIVQESLSTLLVQLRSGQLHDVENVLALLNVIARRRAIDMKRSSRFGKQVSDEGWGHLENLLCSEEACDASNGDEAIASLADIPGMSPLNLQLIELRADGLTWTQIALRLKKRGWSYTARALRVHWHRLRPYFDRRRDDFLDRLG